MRGNPDNLRKAAAAKSAATLQRAEHGLIQMLHDGQPITFRGLAQTAGASLDFLYHHNDLRHRVEHLRAQQQTRTPHPDPAIDLNQPRSVVRTLTAQLAELKRRHREETPRIAAGPRSRPRREPRAPPPPHPPSRNTRPRNALKAPSQARPQAFNLQKHPIKDQQPQITARCG